jgi:hypothetical protein
VALNRDLDPRPEERLSQEEIARAVRFRRALGFCAAARSDCLREAAQIVDRLDFVIWMHRDKLEARR